MNERLNDHWPGLFRSHQGEQETQLWIVVPLVDCHLAPAAKRVLDGLLFAEGKGDRLASSLAGRIVDSGQPKLSCLSIFQQRNGALVGV